MKFVPREGDWKCPKCSYLVYASRDTCPKCEPEQITYEMVDDKPPAPWEGIGRKGEGKTTGKEKVKGKRARKVKEDDVVTTKNAEKEVWLMIGRHGEDQIARSLSTQALQRECFSRMSFYEEYYEQHESKPY